MNNQLVSENNVSKTTPEWPRVNIPGNAVQGSILLTVNQFVDPPQDASNLKWLAMEDIIGTANVKMVYNEETNLFNFYKAKGHLNNDKTWVYEWTLFGKMAGISEEVQQELKNLKYVSYYYDTNIPNSLVVYGIKKDGSQELLCNINFVTPQEFAIAINNLSTRINDEVIRATNRENQIASDLSSEIERATDRENQIASDLSSETHRATAIENTLQNSINDVRENLSEYIGSFNNKAELDDYIGTLNNNDYAVVLNDETHDNQCWRYIYKASSSSWIAQYMVNETPLTQAQNAAINSGVTARKVEQIEQNKEDIKNINTEIGVLQKKLIPGNGIDITNNVVSVKCGNGITVDTTGVKAKGGNGIDVNANGVNVATGDTTQIISDKVEVKPYQGIVNTPSGLSTNNGDGITFDANNKIAINTNFTTSPTELGNNPSGFVLHADGKLEVQAGIIQPEYIGTMSWNRSTNLFATLTNAKIKRHNLFLITHQLKKDSGNWANIFSNLVSVDANSTQSVAFTSPVNPYQRDTSGNTQGWLIQEMELVVNTSAGTISQIEMGKWMINSWKTGTPNVNWVSPTSIYDSTWTSRIRVYGI